MICSLPFSDLSISFDPLKMMCVKQVLEEPLLGGTMASHVRSRNSADARDSAAVERR